MSKLRDEHDVVKEAYGAVARSQSSCCGPKKSCCEKGYTVPDQPVPEAELGLSCGNPVAFLQIKEGDVVLDLGSGAGKDVFLAARKVGPAGKAIGVDMTPDMLALARRNAEKFRQTTGLSNVEFREGEIESLPVPDAAVDIIISNCVINLSPDKPKVFREAFRVLKPGGRLVVSDIVLNRALPERLRNDKDLYSACIAGALQRDEYLAAIRVAGFSDIRLLSDSIRTAFRIDDAALSKEDAEALEGAVSSVTVAAARPCGCSCRKC